MRSSGYVGTLAMLALSATSALLFFHTSNNLGMMATNTRVARTAMPARMMMMNKRLAARNMRACATEEFDLTQFGDLPYNALEVGLNQAIEDAARRRDTAAARILEKVRRAKHEHEMSGRDVPWYRGGSKDRDRYDGVMNMSPLEEQRMEIERTRRSQDQQTAEKLWQREDALISDVKAKGMKWDDKGPLGLPMDVVRVCDDAAKALYKSLSEPHEGGKLISMRINVDPMPWWDFPSDLTLPIGIINFLKNGCAGYEKVAVIPPRGANMADLPLDQLAIGDVENADVVFILHPDLSSPERIEEVHQMSKLTKSGDVVVLDGKFGEPGSFEGKKIRQNAKQLFTGGVESIQFAMPPVKLVRNVGGDPYPLPSWLQAAGYKATGNLAITGNSGTGKSSLTNAMRGLKARDDGAAAVGVKETTLEPTPYHINVDGKELSLYDLPGAGTPKFPLATYIQNMGIKYFDLVIVASAGRFTENDLELMDELRRHAIPFFALRTKIDLEIRNAEQDSGASAQETLDKIRKDLEHYTLLPPDRIYMVSSRRPQEFDFQRLKDDTQSSLMRALDLKLAKALTRKLEVQNVWNAL